MARLQVIDGDPDEADRLRGWFTTYPDWSLKRDGRHWRLSDGREREDLSLVGGTARRARAGGAEPARRGATRLHHPLDDILARLREQGS